MSERAAVKEESDDEDKDEDREELDAPGGGHFGIPRWIGTCG